MPKANCHMFELMPGDFGFHTALSRVQFVHKSNAFAPAFNAFGCQYIPNSF